MYEPELPPGVYRLKPYDLQTQISFGQKKTSPHSSFTFYTVPILPNYAMTCEKVQGSILDRMILGPVKHSSRPSTPHAFLYVSLSRVRCLDRLHLTQPLTMSEHEREREIHIKMHEV